MGYIITCFQTFDKSLDKYFKNKGEELIKQYIYEI